MEDLLYDEFDFSQYDPLANINAILEEIAQKNLDIEEIATTMEELGNATPEKVAQIDIIEREIQEMKRRTDYYLAHLTKLWHDRLWEDILLPYIRQRADRERKRRWKYQFQQNSSFQSLQLHCVQT